MQVSIPVAVACVVTVAVPSVLRADGAGQHLLSVRATPVAARPAAVRALNAKIYPPFSLSPGEIRIEAMVDPFSDNACHSLVSHFPILFPNLRRSGTCRCD